MKFPSVHNTKGCVPWFLSLVNFYYQNFHQLKSVTMVLLWMLGMYFIFGAVSLPVMGSRVNPIVRYCFSTGISTSDDCPLDHTLNNSFSFGEQDQNVLNPIDEEDSNLILECKAKYPIRWLANAPLGSWKLNTEESKYSHVALEYVHQIYLPPGSSSFSRRLRCESLEEPDLGTDVFLKQPGSSTLAVTFERAGPNFFIVKGSMEENSDIVPCVAKEFGNNQPTVKLTKLNNNSPPLSDVSTNCAICTCAALSGCRKDVFPCFSSNVCGQLNMSVWNSGASAGNPVDVHKYEECVGNFGCATCTLQGNMNSYKGEVKDCNGDGILSCDDYFRAQLLGVGNCEQTIQPPQSEIYSRFTSCFDQANENFNITETPPQDYDPRIGSRLPQAPDLRAMYQCSSSHRSVFTMFPLTESMKTNATLIYDDQDGESSGIRCLPDAGVHSVDLQVGSCDSVTACDLKFRPISPYVSFVKAPKRVGVEQFLHHNGSRGDTPKKIKHGFVQCTALFRPQLEPDIFGYVYESAYLYTGLDDRQHLLSDGESPKSSIKINDSSTEPMAHKTLHYFNCFVKTFVILPEIHFKVVYRADANFSEPIKTWRQGSQGFYETKQLNLVVQWTLSLQVVKEMESITCYAPMLYADGYANATMRLNVDPVSPTDVAMQYIIVGLSVAGGVILPMTVILCVLWKKYRRSLNTIRNLTKAEIEEFYFGEKTQGRDAKGENGLDAYNLAFKEEMMISSSRLKTGEEVLGSGEFGIVYKGIFDSGTVAVKSCKSNADVDYFKAFLKEIKVMAFIGDHENIVKFHGAVVDKIRERECYAVIELSPLGNLNSYLQKNASKYYDDYNTTISDNTIIPSAETGATEVLALSTLVSFCRQITAGMEFLSLKKVIHADLATRNVLVFNGGVVKVTDFGLSRKLYDCSNYTKTKQAPLPWRWMALESLRYFQFSTKSDVWSFGVTAWEIFSLSQVPFAGLTWTPDFTEQMEAGQRLSKPPHAPPAIYALMMRCWENDPDRRPTFTECKTFIDSLE